MIPISFIFPTFFSPVKLLLSEKKILQASSKIKFIQLSRIENRIPIYAKIKLKTDP